MNPCCVACRAMQQGSELLEITPIQTVHGGQALYGISYAAIRSVASGGKVCLVALDTTGAATLFNDDRIEAAFAYVVPPSLAEMERRLRARLKEAESTIARRVEWAREQVRCPPTALKPVCVVSLHGCWDLWFCGSLWSVPDLLNSVRCMGWTLGCAVSGWRGGASSGLDAVVSSYLERLAWRCGQGAAG